jgi:putative protease
MKKPELLAPAGSLEKLKTAVRYGADAVYLGGEEFSLRSAGDNFSVEDIKRGIDFARENGKKVYVAINAIMRNDDIDRIGGFINDIYLAGADSVIVSDLGALETVKQAAPGLAVHISTQANTTNYKRAAFWHKLGAKRVVLARELSGEEVRQIKGKAPKTWSLKFLSTGNVHILFGRCLLSNYMAGRDANRGDCAHPCRWKYSLEEEKRPGSICPFLKTKAGAFFFNSKDLCLIEFCRK